MRTRGASRTNAINPCTTARHGIAALVVLVAACTSDTVDSGQEVRAEQLKSQDLMVTTYRVKLSDSAFIERGRKLASVFLGRELPELPKESFVDSIDGIVVWRDVGNEVGVMLTYAPKDDDLEIKSVPRETDYSGLSTLPFMSKDEAQPIYLSKLAELEAAGLIEMGSLDMKNLRVGTTEVGEGALGEEPAPPEVIDYRFKVKRLIGGLQIRNSLVRVSVTRKGEIGSIRILRGGIDLIPDSTVAQAVDDAACAERFNREYTHAAILHHGTGYFIPKPFTGEAVVEPQCYFSFSEKFSSPQGTVVARRKDVLYSVLVADSEPEIFGGPEGNEQVE